MSHDLIDRSVLSLGDLEENDDDGDGNDNNEHQKDIGREDLGKVGEGESETQVGHPVGEHADGERGWSSVLSEAFGYVQEWDWSEAYCEAHYEHDYAYDAQVREDDGFCLFLLIFTINSTFIYQFYELGCWKSSKKKIFLKNNFDLRFFFRIKK